MKQSFTLLFLLLSLSLPAQIQRITQTTYEANSPSVWAKNFSASYGIKPSVLDGLADLYKKDGLDSLARQKKVEKLIRDFQVVAPKEQKKLELSAADRQKLGIADRPDVAEGLEFHLYTQGANSPAVYALGNVKIWYGIPKKAFLGIVAVLEEKQSQIEDFDKKLREQVEKFEELRAELAARADNDAVAKRAKQLLDEGNIAEAERILEEDFDRDAKKLAYKAFELAEVKVLALKYNEATPYYQKAALLDENNSKYLLRYGRHLHDIARYDEAIVFYQKALDIDTVAFKDQSEKTARVYNNIGIVYLEKGEYDRAITFFGKALAIDSVVMGKRHPSIAQGYHNLASAMVYKGEYDRAIAFFEIALTIFVQSYGETHPYVANQYSSIGVVWQHKKEYDQAISFYKKALSITIQSYGERHPEVAICYNNLGDAYNEKGEYDRAISLFELALPIFVQSYGEKHPYVAICYNNLGVANNEKRDYNRAIAFFEKALPIFIQSYGEKHTSLAALYRNLGGLHRHKRNPDNAIVFFKKSLDINIIFFGENHIEVAADYYNLGTMYYAKRDYDSAITYFEKAMAIYSSFSDPDLKFTTQFNSHAADDRGMELFREKKYAEALPYFQKALENAVQAEDWSFSLTCLNNVGSMHKRLGQYAEGLAALEKGLARSEQINLGIDEEIKKLPPETLQKPEVQAKIAEMKNVILIRRMRYHKAGCLVGLGHKKEADELYQQLLKEAREAKDDRLLEDLKNDGIGN